MKSLWFFIVFICVVSCDPVHKDEKDHVEEEVEGLEYPLVQESVQEYPDLEVQELNLKESDDPSYLDDLSYWNFNSFSNGNLKLGKEDMDLGEDFDKKFNEMLSSISESKYNDESYEEWEDDDFLYDFDLFIDKLNKQREDKNSVDKIVNVEEIQLPSVKSDNENNDKRIEGNDDIGLSFQLGNDYDFYSDKSTEEKEDLNTVNKDPSIDTIMWPSIDFDQETDKLPEKKENDDPIYYDYYILNNFNKIMQNKNSIDKNSNMEVIPHSPFEFNEEYNNKLPEKQETPDLLLFQFGNDYDYFSNKLDQEMNDMYNVDKQQNIEFTLLTDTEKKTLILSMAGNLNIEDPAIEDGKKDGEWGTLTEGKYFGSNEYTENEGFDDRILAVRYINRSSMFVISTVILVFSITLFGCCLLCKIFNPKKQSHLLNNKESPYQPLTEEIA